MEICKVLSPTLVFCSLKWLTPIQCLLHSAISCTYIVMKKDRYANLLTFREKHKILATSSCSKWCLQNKKSLIFCLLEIRVMGGGKAAKSKLFSEFPN